MLYKSATLSGQAAGHPWIEVFETGMLTNIAAIRAEDKHCWLMMLAHYRLLKCLLWLAASCGCEF